MGRASDSRVPNPFQSQAYGLRVESTGTPEPWPLNLDPCMNQLLQLQDNPIKSQHFNFAVYLGLHRSLPWYYIDQQSNVDIYVGRHCIGSCINSIIQSISYSMRYNVLKMVPCLRESNSSTSRPHAYHAGLTRDPQQMPEYPTPLCGAWHATTHSALHSVLYAIPHHLLPAHACNRTQHHNRKLICCCSQ